MTPTLYYAGKSWRAIGWCSSLQCMVGLRTVDGALVIESWETHDTHKTQAVNIDNLPVQAVLDKFAHLISQ